MRIIPAIDIIDGKCVRLSQGDYSKQKIYNENPLEVAKEFEANGIQYLHLVDLDGAKSNEIKNFKTLEQICKNTNLKVDFGGGIKTEKSIEIAFDSGANQVNIGSVAVQQKDLFLEWLEKYGTEKIILSADCKNKLVASSGWLDQSDLEILEFIDFYTKKGIKNIVCTDISKDGMLAGTSNELYQEILKNNSIINLIASGGISSFDDVLKIEEIGCEGVIIGKAIYENRISLKQLCELC
ncbi:1-(5-phosphoribosyl)-5-[(5-phosphoribosylamino)methylideneamino]imidazole-4-carboxamide isomerase [Aureivirga sp. CE67]|uniref:1-(5-phosphoribosyl)-5-[(5- phosphoribosylamino)methylideneamino]imidazole-4- carboxamide isomerase n=1 Tax=Aureivirga sp. CE67 TaxID=1788983 RepID=UPI0018CA6061|nr:1-(5-phosphoribosyl)-5-[(5-phosphoribosylamino)methylideneamino]imidazole-4-carboxamide isomerase [Aureivirga sp. CE67]